MASFTILDGSMGSELIKRGLILPKHVWSAVANINKPELVLQIHREYVEAGSDYITTNTFRTTPRAYAKIMLGNNGSEVCVQDAKTSFYKAIELAKKASGSSTRIIGSIAPLEDCYQPDLYPGRDIAKSEFAELGNWFSEAGINILLLETMNSIIETESALEALVDFNFTIWVSFIMKDKNRLLSGDMFIEALDLLHEYRISTVLLNCNPLDLTFLAVDNIVDNWNGDWGIYPNLGRGKPSTDGNISEYETMKKFLYVIRHVLDSGASIVGACCGSSPKHINYINKLQHDSK